MAVRLKTRLPLAILMNHNVCFVVNLLNQAGITLGTQESCVTFANGMQAAAQKAAWHGSACPPEKGAGTVDTGTGRQKPKWHFLCPQTCD